MSYIIHCVTFQYIVLYSVFSNPAIWTLHFGKQNASGSAEYTYEQVRTISKLTIHPDYQPEAQNFSFNNDVALIKLDRPVVFNDYTAPLCLVQQADHVTDHVIEERECTITGYGIANKTHSKSWPRGYKTLFMVNSVEHKILNAHKYKNRRKFSIFLGLDKLIMLFFLFINVKMPTMVGILTFMSRKNFMLN